MTETTFCECPDTTICQYKRHRGEHLKTCSLNKNRQECEWSRSKKEMMDKLED